MRLLGRAKLYLWEVRTFQYVSETAGNSHTLELLSWPSSLSTKLIRNQIMQKDGSRVGYSGLIRGQLPQRLGSQEPTQAKGLSSVRLELTTFGWPNLMIESYFYETNALTN